LIFNLVALILCFIPKYGLLVPIAYIISLYFLPFSLFQFFCVFSSFARALLYSILLLFVFALIRSLSYIDKINAVMVLV
jgi:hypothetical protein